MYHMKNIINCNEEIALPKCMYHIKNATQYSNEDEIVIGITSQEPNKKMIELEQRQDELLKKLDVLYDRIKKISSNCKMHDEIDDQSNSAKKYPVPEEIVLAFSPDILPWYLILLRESTLTANITWHIHSSITNENMPKIKGFLSKLPNVKQNSEVNIRLIFKNVSVNSELKISSLAVPIVGNVNILRYLSYVFPGIIPYDYENYYVDYLLDICHQLERVSDKNKDALISKLFYNYTTWIYGNEFTIVDLSAYNIIKQCKTSPKNVPKPWLKQCEKLFS